MREQRKQVLRKLKGTPSLGPPLDVLSGARVCGGGAVTLAIGEAGLDTFPDVCSWDYADVLADKWLPPS